MLRKREKLPAEHRARIAVRLLAWLGFGLSACWGTIRAGDLLRGGAPVATTGAPLRAGGDTTLGSAALTTPSQDRLARTTQALEAVRQMQTAARNLAIAGGNNLRADLAAVPLNSYGQANGLRPATGVDKLWTGANQPVEKSQTTGGVTSTTVTITQLQQQALLTWESFNVGKTTTLTYDQSAGGSNAGQWIAFNYVRDPTGVPSQILGSIKTIGQPGTGGAEQVGGQVYVMNANGIIFGGSAQVNVHALVASSLPINYNLIQRGILNNPDTQFLFTALSQPAGSKGPTAAFDPTQASEGLGPVQTSYAAGGNYGDVTVQAGAQLSAPTNADRVGGRIALVGPNVTNAGTLSTPDGQTILAAGLQVGFAAHATADPTLRGLDVYVGAVADPAGMLKAPAGIVTNDRVVLADNTVQTGLISAPRGAITLTGQTVNQRGFIESSTSVAYNGRVDLVAGYNAVANPKYDPSSTANDFTLTLPFFYQSNAGNTASGAVVANSGLITLGKDSVLRILPETASTEKAPGDLALPSQVNIQGQAVHFETGALVLAPGAAVPLKKAYGFDGRALEAGVTIRAGAWFNPADTRYSFVHSADNQQIYLEQGAAVDVAGLGAVTASVTDNIVDVELRGSELADSPLQRDSPLRGQTVQVDIRQHGPWDPTLNGGLGGYTWVGTPLGNTAGWVGLTQHTVGQLSVNGGSVALKAGGAVVLQKDSAVDVSGGFIDYAGGYIATTKLAADGHVYDIAKATPDRRYTGIQTGVTTTTDEKWGVTETSTNPLAQSTYEAGYRQGGSAGSVALAAPAFALDGSLLGSTTASPVQRNLSSAYNPAAPPNPANPVAAGVNRWLLDALNRPLPAQFSLTVGRQYPGATGNYVRYSPTPANIVFGTGAAVAAAEAFKAQGDYLFPSVRKFEIALAPALFSSAAGGGGFGIVRIDNSDDAVGLSPGLGNITIKAGTNLALGPGGSLNLAAGNITVESQATVSAPGGLLAFNAYTVSPSTAEKVAQLANPGPVPEEDVPVYNPLRGTVTVNAGATLDAAGAVVDDRVNSHNPTAGTLPQVTSGGSIVLNASNVVLKAGSGLNVSGGAVIGTTGKLTYGDAGSITLKAGRVDNNNRALTGGNEIGTVIGGRLNLTGAILEGVAGPGRNGGKLTLEAPAVAIAELANGATTATNATTGTLTLAPVFFNAGGFTQFAVTGLGVAVGGDGRVSGAAPAFTVAPKVQVAAAAQSWVTLPGGDRTLAPVGLSRAVSLDFKTTGLFSDANNVLLDNNSVDLVVGAGAVLATDPGGSVSLSGGSIDLLGSITAQGGTITVAQTGIGSQFAFLPGLHLGPATVLDASGTTTYAQDLNGYHKADVLDGGTIKVSGNVLAEKGAVLNVSGTSDTVLVTPGQLPDGPPTGTGAQLVAATKDSNGGKITLQGEQVLFTAATLQGAAGGSTARNGELAVVSNAAAYKFLVSRVQADNITVDVQPTEQDVVLRVSAKAPDFVYAGIGHAVKNTAGQVYGDAQGLGLSRFGADSVAGGGFGVLTLGVAGRGAVQVEGEVVLAANRQVTVADGGVLSFVPAATDPVGTNPALIITAPYVVLGQAFQPPQQALSLTAAPVNGTGRLAVRAGTLIDAGNLVLQGAGSAVLDASDNGTTAGTIRGNGTLTVAGDILLRAGQIYPPTSATFNVIASDYTKTGALVATSGSVAIQPGLAGAIPALPLAAGGSLNIYASTITQGGVLRAPLGQIRLGADNTAGLNPLTGESLPVTKSLTVLPGSVTSVSAVDPVTGKPVTIPFGINVNGDTWIDPSGTDITNVGPGAKSITLTADAIDFQTATTPLPAASIDLRGGGDLSAYQFVPGAGGSKDLLSGATATGFAIVPGYADAYSPYAPYSSSADATFNLASDPGYVVGSAKLSYKVGDRIHLEAGGGLPAGDYTLLPARYALLPGAYLVTPQADATTSGARASVTRYDGASLVAGYRYNALDGAGKDQALFRTFELAPQGVVLKRAEYKKYEANAFFGEVAKLNDTVAPRLPVDAGQLGLSVGTDLRLKGSILSQAATGGRGGLIDLSSAADIVIGSHAVVVALEAAGMANTVLLEAKQLTGYGAESLLIGGSRTTDTTGTTVTVKTNHITVDNAGEALSGPDVILAANQSLTLKDNAEVGGAGLPAITADPLRITGTTTLGKIGDSITLARGGVPLSLPSGTPGTGKLTATSAGTVTAPDGTKTPFLATTTGLANAFTVPVGGTITLDTAGSIALASSADTKVKSIPLVFGDGALLRVGSDPTATITRVAIAAATTPVLSVGAGARIIGGSAILDSTQTTDLSGAVDLSNVKALSLNSGRISVLLDQPGGVATTDSLVLARPAQESLFKSVTALSLLSYSTLDLYGIGSFGSATLESLALHAGAIRGILLTADPAATTTLVAKQITLDNAANVAAPAAPVAPVAGRLKFDTGTLQLGGNAVETQNYAAVEMNATAGIITGDAAKTSAHSGGLTVKGGTLTITSPLIVGAKATDQFITAEGSLTLNRGTGTATVAPGLAASLRLTGKTVDVGTDIRLPSGNLTVNATSGKLSVSGGALDVGGTAQHFYDVTRYTDGGRIALFAATGDMAIASGSKLSVSADSGGGSAGTVSLFVPQGSLAIAEGSLLGKAGTGGQGGTFTLDTLGLPGSDPAASHLATLADILSSGGFTRSVDLRLREGDVVVDGSVRAHEYALAADHGSITVNGSIDASGLVGSNRNDPLGGTPDVADPTGGKISLAASRSVILTPSAWLTAAGYIHDNAGTGGSIALSAGGYTYRTGLGQVDAAGIIDIQSGARLDLGVKQAFTANDLLLHPGPVLPVSNRTDLITGTLHLREPQAAFGNGSQFSGLAGAVNGASGIVLEGFQVFDLTGTNGAVSTTGAITSIGSGGLVNAAVENAVKGNGTAFLAAVSPAILANPLLHVRPGAEIVNNAAVSSTATYNFVTFNSSVAASRSLVNFNLKPGNGVFTTTLIPGGLPVGVTLRLGAGQTRTLRLTFADGSTSGPSSFTASTDIKSTSATNPIVMIEVRNTGSTALATQLNFFAGTAPLTLALDPTTTITSSTFAGRYANQSGDLVLANTWDLSTFRYGTAQEPGHLTLRAAGNLVFGYDASLSDGFDPTHAIVDDSTPASVASYPLWTAPLQNGLSSSYRLVAGADYGAADSRAVRSLGSLAANSGSVLIGQGALALPTATSGSTVTRRAIIPRYFQTIRTGTGDIEITAARDVQFLNPLATVYTAGRLADPLTGFDVPVLNSATGQVSAQLPYYPAQYSRGGGDVSIRAQNDIARYLLSGTTLVANSSREMPGDWLYRRGTVGDDGKFVPYVGTDPTYTEVQSTSWWVDYSNFFADTGALGGGNVLLTAGRQVSNINAAAPTNARMPGRDALGAAVAPDATKVVELGGGDVLVRAGADIDGGVYYVERGAIDLRAGGAVKTNSTRAALTTSSVNPVTWLPTTFFLGKGSVNVVAGGDIRAGAVANPFWLPQGLNNRLNETSFFSTFDPGNTVSATSLGGTITFQVKPDGNITSGASLLSWYNSILAPTGTASAGAAQPWLRLGTVGTSYSTYILSLATVANVLPATLRATAFTGDIDVVGSLTLSPSPSGTIELLAAKNLNGVRINGVSGGVPIWGSGVISLSDADPARIPGITSPLAFALAENVTKGDPRITVFPSVNALFAESGRNNFSLEEKLALHGQTTDAAGKPVPLHYNDAEPVRLYAAGGDLSGLTLYSAKSARVLADHDITDVGLYVQNVRNADNTVVAAGHDIVAYNPNSALRVIARQPGNTLASTVGETGPASGAPTTGDIQLAGPGLLEVLAGRNLDLGNGSNARKDGMAVGITTVGAVRNPYLSQNNGAGIIAAAGVGDIYSPAAAAVGQAPGLATTNLKFDTFISKFLDPATGGELAARYLPVLGLGLGVASTDPAAIWAAFGYTPGQALSERKASLLVGIFNLVLRDAARDLTDPDRPFTTKYANGFAAIEALFPASPRPTGEQLGSDDALVRPEGPWSGRISMPTRLIKTVEGGDIALLVPGGSLTVGRGTDPQKPDQGVLTERGGAILIFAADSVNVGTSRIFTLRGGDEVIWSTWGDIAAGSGSKTVFSAPPTRVLVDPQSGDVQNDLAGLATGSGIGVLATLSGVKPGDVDLIAPVGTIDAGDAGIRSSGNVNLSAPTVLNGGNINSGGKTSGTPPPPPSPNLGALSAAATASAGASSAATEVTKQGGGATPVTELPSLFSVEVLGYGGDDEEDEKDKASPATSTPGTLGSGGGLEAGSQPVAWVRLPAVPGVSGTP